jgi:spore maturation protein CgeB
MRVFLAGSHMSYNLEHYLEMAMSRRGHEVRFFGWDSMLGSLATITRMMSSRYPWFRSFLGVPIIGWVNRQLLRQIAEWKPDIFLSVKGETIFPETVTRIRRELGVATTLWFPDDPRYFDSLVKYIAPSYDHVFTSSERSIEMYRNIGVENVHYLPFACEPSIHLKTDLSEEEHKLLESDVCFVGSYSRRRAKILKRLGGFRLGIWGPFWEYSSLKRKIRGKAWGPQMAKVLSASKIVLNIHDEQDLGFKANMRVFETTGCGAFLLTDRPYGIEKLYAPHKEIACYDDDELGEMVAQYLDDPSAREEIVSQGQARAYRDHTYDQRVQRLLRTIS